MPEPIYNAEHLSDVLAKTMQAIAKHMQDNSGQSPTLDEIGALLTPPLSKGAISQQMGRLEERGYIKRNSSIRIRNIRLTQKAIDFVQKEAG